MKKIAIPTLVAGALAAGIWSIAFAEGADASRAITSDQGQRCRANTLRGSYLFTASGFNIVSGVAQPKAIQEALDFNGDGTLTTPAVTVSLNGTILHPPGAPGDYTLG